MATLSLNSARVAGWTVSDLFFAFSAATVAAGLLNGTTRNLATPEMRRSSPVLLVGSLLLLTFGTLSSFWALDPVISMLSVIRFGWLTIIWFWLLRAVSPDRASLMWLIRGYRATVLFSSVIAILGFLGLIHLSYGQNWENRQGGLYGNSNQLAGLLAVGLPLFFLDVYRAESPEHSRPISRRLVSTGLVLVGIGSTGSISAMLGVAVGLLMIGLIRVIPNRRQAMHPLKGLAIAVVIATAVVGFIHSGSPVIERISRFMSGDSYVQSSVSTRGELNDYVIDHIGDQLLVGTGLDQLASGDDQNLADLPVNVPTGGIHNMYLKVLYEAGLPALCGLFILLIATLRRSWRLVLYTRGGDLHPLAVALLPSLVTANVMAQFQPFAWERFYWLPVALVGVLWALCRNELEVANQATPPTPLSSAHGNGNGTGVAARRGPWGQAELQP